MADTRVGRYRLVRRVGRGGMAEVWEATAEGPGGFEKQVALKRILPHLCDDEPLVTMFEDEARLASRLTHPQVAQVFDYGLHDGVPYLVMEWVGGRDLRRVLKALKAEGDGLSVPQVVEIGRSVAAALAHAHALTDRGGRPLEVVHRDVSPQNVLLSFEGEVKLADFGIAKAAHRRTHTGVGVLKGKAAYMSPEQARGLPVDRRSDLFSLGVVLWECLCRRDLFTGDTDLEVLRAILEEEPLPPSSVRPEVPAGLDAVVMRCLAKDPGDRWTSAGALEAALFDQIVASGWPARALALGPLMRRLFPEEATGRTRGTARLPLPTATAAPTDSLGVSIDVDLPDDETTRVTRAEGAPVPETSETAASTLPRPAAQVGAETRPLPEAATAPAGGAPRPASPLRSTRATVPLGAALAVALLVVAGWALWGHLGPPAMEAPPAPRPAWIPPPTLAQDAIDPGPFARPAPAPPPPAPATEAVPSLAPKVRQVAVRREAPRPRSRPTPEPPPATPPEAPASEPVAGGVIALSGAPTRPVQGRLPAGTRVSLRLDAGVGEGEAVTASLERSVILGGEVLLQRGTRFSGRTQRAADRLLVAFDEVRLPDGTRLSVSARVLGDDGAPGVRLPGGAALAEVMPAQLPRGTHLTVALTAPLLLGGR